MGGYPRSCRDTRVSASGCPGSGWPQNDGGSTMTRTWQLARLTTTERPIAAPRYVEICSRTARACRIPPNLINPAGSNAP